MQESCNAAEYRLFKEHISDVELGKIESWLTLMHKVKKFKADRLDKAKKLLSSVKNNQRLQIVNATLFAEKLEKATSLVNILTKNLERFQGKISIARFLFDRYLFSSHQPEL